MGMGFMDSMESEALRGMSERAGMGQPMALDPEGEQYPDFAGRVEPSGQVVGKEASSAGASTEGAGKSGDAGEARYKQWEERLAAREAALDARLSSVMENFGKGGPSSAAAATEGGQKKEEPFFAFRGIEETMTPEDWAALPAESKNALRAISAMNRTNLEALAAKVQGAGANDAVAALQKRVEEVNAAVLKQQEQARSQAWQVQAEQAKKAYGVETLAPHAQKIAGAMTQYGLSVEDAIRFAAPEVWIGRQRALLAKQVRAQVEREMRNEAMFGEGKTVDPANLGYEEGEDFATSMGKVAMRMNGPGL